MRNNGNNFCSDINNMTCNISTALPIMDITITHFWGGVASHHCKATVSEWGGDVIILKQDIAID